jgi:hypothetical protein
MEQLLGSIRPCDFALGAWMPKTACLTVQYASTVPVGTLGGERLAPQSLRLCCALVKRGVMRAFARAVASLTRSACSPMGCMKLGVQEFSTGDGQLRAWVPRAHGEMRFLHLERRDLVFSAVQAAMARTLAPFRLM